MDYTFRSDNHFVPLFDVRPFRDIAVNFQTPGNAVVAGVERVHRVCRYGNFSAAQRTDRRTLINGNVSELKPVRDGICSPSISRKFFTNENDGQLLQTVQRALDLPVQVQNVSGRGFRSIDRQSDPGVEQRQKLMYRENDHHEAADYEWNHE